LCRRRRFAALRSHRGPQPRGRIGIGGLLRACRVVLAIRDSRIPRPAITASPIFDAKKPNRAQRVVVAR